MKWYPWLNEPYRQILAAYQQGQGHPVLLLHSQEGNGELSLIYALSRWLICRHPNEITNCGICHSCQLVKAGNHPDYYQPKPDKEQQSLGVENIYTLIDNLYRRARQGGVKIVWLAQSEQLTTQAANALLKILEEPPIQTYFLMGCQEPSRLLPTLRSRCFYWRLPSPTETLGLCWLQQMGTDSLSATVALRLSGGAPLAAQALLLPMRWQKRLTLCKTMAQAIASNDLLLLLPSLNRNKDDAPLCWLLSLLIDALKWLQGGKDFLVNADQTKLINALSKRWPIMVLHYQLQQWLTCRRQFQEIGGINQELLLTHYLLNWEQNTNNLHIHPLDFV